MGSQRVGNDWATFTFLFEDWNNLSFPPNFQVQYSLLCFLNSLRIYCQHGAQWLWILQCVTPQNIIETRMWLLTNSDHVIIWSYAISSVSSVQWLSHVRLFVTPWIAARQASLSITKSWSSLKLTSIVSVMPSSHLILCCPLLLLLPIPPSIRVLSNESTLRMRWPKWMNSILEWR